MSGPWEDYQNSDTDNGNGPWNDYAASPTSEKPKNTSFMGKLNAAINKAGVQTGKLTGLGNPLNPIAGAEEGLISFPIKAAQTGSQAISSILPKGAQNKLSGFNNTNIDQWLFQHGIGTSDNSLPTQLAQGSAAFAIPGSQEAKIASLIESASKLAPQGSSLLARLISGGESGLVNTNNSNDKLSNALGQGELNAVVPPALDKGANALKALGRLFKPSRALRGTLSPEELKTNLRQTAGTNTGLGQVLGKKKLQDILEIKAPQYYGTGANEIMQETGNQIRSQGSNLLDQMRGDTQPQNVPTDLQEALQEADKDTNAKSKELALKLNDEATQKGIKVSNENQIAAAKAKLEEIKEDDELGEEIPLATKAKLKKVVSGPKEQTLKNADISKSNLNDKAQSLFETHEKYQGGIYASLRDAKQKDINAALDNAKDSNVVKLRDEYRQHFREEKAPFEDPDVLKFTRFGGDPDLFLKTFLKTGQTDRPRQLQKLMDKLPANKKDLVPYAYYSKARDANGNIDPNKLVQLHKNLQPFQKAVMFEHNPELLKKMDDYVGLVNKNKKALNVMFSAENGAKQVASTPWKTAATGAAIGGTAAHIPGAAIGGAVGLVAPTVLGKQLTKLLTSASVREKLVNKMLNQKPIKKGASKINQSISPSIGKCNCSRKCKWLIQLIGLN